MTLPAIAHVLGRLTIYAQLPLCLGLVLRFRNPPIHPRLLFRPANHLNEHLRFDSRIVIPPALAL